MLGKRLINFILVGSRLLLGSIFTASGSLKLLSPRAASEMIVVLLPIDHDTATPLVYALSLLEAAIGIFLIWGRLLTLAGLSSGFLLLSSIVVVGSFLPPTVPCGCFGDLMPPETRSFFLLRNFALLGLCLVVLHGADAQPRH